jgi:hypothetical protein
MHTGESQHQEFDILIPFHIHGSVHHNSILIRSNKMQRYAGFYLLQNYSTCFGCPSHPSSGVHKSVTAASGTGHSNNTATTFLQPAYCCILFDLTNVELWYQSTRQANVQMLPIGTQYCAQPKMGNNGQPQVRCHDNKYEDSSPLTCNTVLLGRSVDDGTTILHNISN